MQITSPHPFATASVPFRPLSTSELDWLRTCGRQDQSSDTLARQAIRFRLLSVAGCIPRDVDARLGAERAEVAALFGLALKPAASAEEVQLKRSLFAAISEGRDDNAPAMLAASLAADMARWATLAAGRRAPVNRTSETCR